MNNSAVLKVLKTIKTSWVSKLTDAIFTAEGFQELVDNDYKLLEDFFGLSIRVVLNKILEANPRIPTFYSAIVEEFATEEGGILQRINTTIPRPTSPAYRNLQDGSWINDYKIRKPQASERFYRQNFDFATWITVQEINLRKIFLNENGIAEFVGSITRGLEKSYYIAKFEMLKKVLNGALTSTQTPLQDTQKYDANATTGYPALANITSDNAQSVQQAWKEFQFLLKEIRDTMNSNPLLTSFNAAKFENGVNPDDMVLLIRHSVWNWIERQLGFLNNGTGLIEFDKFLPFKVQVVEDFGDAVRVLASDHSVVLKEVYDDDGTPIGWNTTGTGDPLPEAQIDVVFSNEDVFAVLIQKGAIFATTMNPFTIRAKESYRGMYINYIANCPNGAFNYDSNYNLITFSKATS